MNKKIERIATIGLAAFLVGMFCYQVAYGTSAWKNGYTNGLKDGKGSANDPSPVCGGYNSTSDANECYHAYDLGFKKGCDIQGNRDPWNKDSNPDYPTCYGILH
jgi:hypothetical protein